MTEETGMVARDAKQVLDVEILKSSGGYDLVVDRVAGALAQDETIFVAHTDQKTGKKSYGITAFGTDMVSMVLGVWPTLEGRVEIVYGRGTDPKAEAHATASVLAPNGKKVTAYGMATQAEPRNSRLTIPQLASLAETRACGKVMRRAWGAVTKPAIQRVAEGKVEYEVLPVEPIPDGAGGEVHVEGTVEDVEYRDVVAGAPLSDEELRSLAEVMTDRAKQLKEDGAGAEERKRAHADAIRQGLAWSKDFSRYVVPGLDDAVLPDELDEDGDEQADAT